MTIPTQNPTQPTIDVYVSSAANVGPFFLSGPNSSTTLSNSLSFTNSARTYFECHLEFNVRGSKSWDTAAPATAFSRYNFTTNSSGVSSGYIHSLWPDTSQGDGSFTAVAQTRLTPGDTLTAWQSHTLAHSYGASLNLDAVTRLTVYRRS